MKTTVCGLFAFLSTLALLSHCAVAADDGWKLPNLNPFTTTTTKAKRPATARVSDSPTSGWRMPKLLPTLSTPSSASKQPNALQKMTTGTKNLMNKTAGALNPWQTTAEQPAPKITGSNSAFNQSANNRSAAKKKNDSTGSWLPSSWFTEEKKEPETVTSFLAQPRLQ